MATSTSRVHAVPTAAFVLARVFVVHVAGVAAYVPVPADFGSCDGVRHRVTVAGRVL
ncbi:MAG TPA: hypothetical protein VMA77_23435 [Solirubrobacteraceae bacterium]|nr:hypothetical protein [Solirubrobacteraceae bacterium]